jgi:hypothetical protein
MKKLTLVSLMCRNKAIFIFCYLPVFNGKTVLHSQVIDSLFAEFHGFTPQRGETISFL